MALFHLTVTQVKRSPEQSATASGSGFKKLPISRRGWYNRISFDGPPLLGDLVPMAVDKRLRVRLYRHLWTLYPASGR